MKKAKRADKPGSVVDDHLSRLHVTVQFFARYPSAGRADPWRSYSRLLRKGLAKPPCCHDAGGLLHHRFSFSLYALRRRWESSFLRRFPSDHSARPLAGIPPSGARTFLTPATRAGRAIVWPASRGGIVPCGRRSCERTGLHPCSNSPGLARRPHGGLRLVRKLRADEAPSARKTKRSRCNTGIALCRWHVALADSGPVVRGYG